MTDPILSIAIQTIRIEADTLLALAASLDQTSDFRDAVRAIHGSSGRVVLTGIGKSAIVAQKIVSTLNSTGQPAIFLHAADAIHGDLGMIQSADLVICISKSGESPEIKVLIPLLKNFGNPVIAMTAQRQSFLGQQADYLLWTPVEQEADPNNLAPTASTTAQMALGDALAVALLALRGFSAADFAKFHPGGALGKQLYLRVSDLYTQHGRPVVRDTDTLPQILLEISAQRLGATAVLDANDQLLGIITDGDLRRMLAHNKMEINHLTAKDILTPAPQCIHSEALAVDALALLRQHSITQLVVIDAETSAYVGMIHVHDLVREGLI